MPLLGAHCSTAGGLWRSFERGQGIGCDAIQVFTKSNRQWQARDLRDEEIEMFKTCGAECGLAVVAHASYLINLASPKEDIWRKSVASYVTEMHRCRALGIPNLVLHPGAHTGSGIEAGIARLIEAINHEHDSGDESAMLLLEITAGTGTSLGHHIDHFVEVLSRVRYPERVGLCFDTCHAIGAGWDITTDEGYDDVMSRLDREIGLDKVRCFHLNDSQHPVGSRRDRHAHIGLGTAGLATFRRLLNDPRFAGVPMVLETPKDEDMAQDRVNLQVLRGLFADAETPVTRADLDRLWEGVDRTPGKDE